MATSYNWSSDEDNGQPKVQGSLLVNDLHSDVTEQVLHTIFQPFGPIRSVKVCRSRRTDRSRDNGFGTFEQHHDAENALVALNYLELMGKPVCDILPYIGSRGCGFESRTGRDCRWGGVNVQRSLPPSIPGALEQGTPQKPQNSIL
uniref:RRM domain-containing protein n=1 Tax=Sinocyclocheilus grahami TaxID=75366 RepID=A0A672NLP0_SINGR